MQPGAASEGGPEPSFQSMVRYGPLADNPTPPAFVRYWHLADMPSDTLDVSF
jgi:hypothetical protein